MRVANAWGYFKFSLDSGRWHLNWGLFLIWWFILILFYKSSFIFVFNSNVLLPDFISFSMHPTACLLVFILHHSKSAVVKTRPPGWVDGSISITPFSEEVLSTYSRTKCLIFYFKLLSVVIIVTVCGLHHLGHWWVNWSKHFGLRCKKTKSCWQCWVFGHFICVV